MAVHSLHIFDRRGKTLFTKRFSKAKMRPEEDEEFLSEQRKLVFGMLFSLREMVGSLAPETPAKEAGEFHMLMRSQPHPWTCLGCCYRSC